MKSIHVYILMHKSMAWAKDDIDRKNTLYCSMEPSVIEVFPTYEKAEKWIEYDLRYIGYTREYIWYKSNIRTLPGTKTYDCQSTYWIEHRCLCIDDEPT